MANFTITENYGTYQGNTSMITDGNTSNCWRANDSNGSGKYVLLTCDTTIYVKSVTYSTTQTSEVFKSGTYLQVSTDSSNYTDIGQFDGNANVTFTVNKNAKYIRIYCKSGSGYVSISELTIDYDNSGGGDDPSESGTFTGSPVASSYTGISQNTSKISQAVGKTAENPATSTSAWYGSNSATVDTQYAQYTFDVSSIPSEAINIKITCKIAGTAENTTYTHQKGGRYSVWGLCCNGATKGSQIYTTSRSVTVVEFSDTGNWTREELNGLQLRHYVGYYGGTTNGVTLTIAYDIPSEDTNYTFMKIEGIFLPVDIFVKTNGVWVLQKEPELDTSKTYVKG